jgi:hypothetical protein
MTWNETHRRWQALRSIEDDLAAGAPEPPWNEEYAELFGDRDGLLAALQYRWRLSRDAQLDTHLPEHVLEEQRRRLDHRARGVLRLLADAGYGEHHGDPAVV